MYDVMIIGAGPAGMTAGIYAARRGLKTVLFEKLFPGGQASTTNIVENYPGYAGGIGGPELMMEFQKQAQGAGCEIIYDTITKVSLSSQIKTAITSNGMVEARAVILCMGASPRKLGVPGESEFAGRGVSYCATCDGALYRNKRTLVVGGGNTALEDALYLSDLCERVYVVHRRDNFRADETSIQRLKNKGNVEIVLNSVVTGFDGTKALESVHVHNLTNDEYSDIPVSGAFIAVGQTPCSQLVNGLLKTDHDGYIIAGESTITSIPGVFAAGDIRTKPLRQIITAAADGAVAASAAGKYLSLKQS